MSEFRFPGLQESGLAQRLIIYALSNPPCESAASGLTLMTGFWLAMTVDVVGNCTVDVLTVVDMVVNVTVELAVVVIAWWPLTTNLKNIKNHLTSIKNLASLES